MILSLESVINSLGHGLLDTGLTQYSNLDINHIQSSLLGTIPGSKFQVTFLCLATKKGVGLLLCLMSQGNASVLTNHIVLGNFLIKLNCQRLIWVYIYQ